MKHPHIVTFFGVTSLFRMKGLVMEFMEGGNLNELIMSDKVLPWSERLRLLHELISAISYLHNDDEKRAFIHGDIKPKNILLTKSRVLKLADFGSVNTRERTGASTSSLEISSEQQTWPYTAPERLQKCDADKTAAMDIYSFGITVYKLLTRKQAYSGEATKDIIMGIIHDGKRPAQQHLDEVDKQLKQHQKQDHEIFLKLQSLMKKCWQQEPTKRPKATEILETTTQQMDELPAMEDSDIETLTDELTTTDGFSIDMEVSSVDDSDGKTITPQVDELPGSTCLIVGGYGKGNIVETYDVNKKSFNPRKPTLYKRWGSTSVKINNHVYTGGGSKSNFVECLNLNQVDGDWYEVASMKEQRWLAASAVLNDQMCVAGGRDGSRNKLSSVELYNPVVNTWTNIPPMKTERWLHALVSYNGRLFAFGGYDKVIGNLVGLESMESFDLREEIWESLKPMNEERRGFCGVVYNDEIYAIGGHGLKSVERYNIRTNTWTYVSSLNHERFGSCACVVNGKIYVIGGDHWVGAIAVKCLAQGHIRQQW
uniref:kelch-like protein 20 isoform X2 n=1 Tax=Ciona intestinalis TaxID=7719 RepID=UPI000EF44D34|nr:kelch-like protein 20 isoform X2 [Ciona intestinalis]|eukprot:XP_026695252.1 kelch-like protein 20 isoform X2 [Ciona intestinalis]